MHGESVGEQLLLQTEQTHCYLSLQEFSWKQPSDNLNSFPLLVAGACFCWHTKTQEL